MRKSIPLAIVLCYSIFQSCSKHSDPNPSGTSNPSTPVVYLAGSYGDQSPGNAFGRAAYWKNDTLNILPGGMASLASGLFVSNGDVYVAGQVDAQPAYWKNGTMVSLSHGFSSDGATAIAVNGQDVYIAGTGFNTLGHSVAGYWKNGVFKQLSDDKDNAYCNAIAISGNDIYITGNEYNPGDAKPVIQGKCWKNGTAVDLTGGGKSTSLNNIHISGNDIYVCGDLADSTDPSGQRATAKCWKNGQEIMLPAGSAEIAVAGSIWVSGSDVYVSGYKKSTANDRAVAIYWKNGNVTTLSDGSTDCSTGNLVVSGTDVFVSYFATPVNGHPQAEYIKNGKVISETDGIKTFGRSNFIFIDNRK